MVYKLLEDFFLNVLSYMDGKVSKIRSLHTYVMHRMFYFERYCISSIIFSDSLSFCEKKNFPKPGLTFSYIS